jgi:hypothetical protein
VKRKKEEPWDYSEHNLFIRSVFPKFTVFYSTEFTEDISFAASVFRSIVNFSSSKFIRRTYFKSTIFRRDAYFDKASFNSFADFSSAEFLQTAYFDIATFGKSSDFKSTTFSGSAYFRSVSFAILGNFDKCAIRNQVRWIWPGDGKKRDKEGNIIERGVLRFTDLQFEEGSILDLRDNSFQDDCKLEIYDCKMKHIMLKGTDCTKITFYANAWPRYHGRIVVGDELEANKNRQRWYPRPEMKWNLIGITYQQLTRRFREIHEHKKANDFSSGVFEMQRLAPPISNRFTRWIWGDPHKAPNNNIKWICRYLLHFLKRFLSLNSMFRYVSLYGISVIRPLLWLVVTTILFGAAYAVAFDSSLGDLLADALRVISVGRVEYEYLDRPEVGVGVEFLKLLQRASAATLVALFIFAIRRRFKH